MLGYLDIFTFFDHHPDHMSKINRSHERVQQDWATGIPHGGTHEVSSDQYYGECPLSSIGRHTWVQRGMELPSERLVESYSVQCNVCVNCGAYYFL